MREDAGTLGASLSTADQRFVRLSSGVEPGSFLDAFPCVPPRAGCRPMPRPWPRWNIVPVLKQKSTLPRSTNPAHRPFVKPGDDAQRVAVTSDTPSSINSVA